MSDLNPNDDELKIVKQSYPNLSDEEALTEARSEKLASLIWTPIMAEFAKTHDVEPTEEEIQGLAKSMNAMKGNLPAELAKNIPKTSAEIEREIYQPFVKNWKISKALHGEYGGTVIFQQANPLEPVGAYRKLLESHEASRKIRICRTGSSDQSLRMSLTKNLYSVAAHLNLGYAVIQSPSGDKLKNRIHGGAATEWLFQPGWAFVAEIFAASRQAQGLSNELEFQIGLKYVPSSQLVLDTAIGRSLRSIGTTVQGTIGLTWMFNVATLFPR